MRTLVSRTQCTVNESNDEASANSPKDAVRNMVVSYRQERAIEIRRRKYLLGVFLIVLMFVLGRDIIFNSIKKVALLAAEPAWQTASVGASVVSDVSDATKSKDVLLAENMKLKRSLDDLTLVAKTDSALRIENAQLRALAGRSSTEPHILARVLTRPPSSAYDTFIIDAGSEEGVVPGMRALIPGDFLVGTVTNVGEHSSILELSSIAGIAYDTMLAGRVNDATTSAPEFTDSASTTITSLDEATTTDSSLTTATTTDISITLPTAPVASTTPGKKVQKDGKGKSKDDAKIAEITARRSSVTFIGLGGGGFRALVPKQVPVVRDEPIALNTTIPTFLGIVTGVYIPPSGSLKEVYGSLPVGIGQIEFVSLAPPLPLPTPAAITTSTSTKK